MVYLVQYDLIRTKDYKSLIEEIKKSPDWAHLLESTWGVETTEDVKPLFDRLSAKTDSDDKLVITQLQRNFAFWTKNLTKELVTWLGSMRERA